MKKLISSHPSQIKTILSMAFQTDIGTLRTCRLMGDKEGSSCRILLMWREIPIRMSSLMRHGAASMMCMHRDEKMATVLDLRQQMMLRNLEMTISLASIRRMVDHLSVEQKLMILARTHTTKV
jgi:hypothetical protein